MIGLKAKFHLIQDRCVISLMKQKTLAESPTSLSLCSPWNKGISPIPSKITDFMKQSRKFSNLTLF